MRSLDSTTPADVTGPDSVREGIERLRLFFAEGESRQAILARQALEQPADDDEALARRVVDDLRAETRMDGSIGGDVVTTIWRAHELLDLGSAGDHAGTVRVLGWVLGLQNKPGAFSEGCSPPRHAHRACEHFISGFFSPAPAEQRFAPVMLPNGKVFQAEPAARFAVSCLALRAALRARLERRPQVQQHLLSLVQLAEQWDDWNGYFAPDAIVSGIHALAFAPQSTAISCQGWLPLWPLIRPTMEAGPRQICSTPWTHYMRWARVKRTQRSSGLFPRCWPASESTAASGRLPSRSELSLAFARWSGQNRTCSCG
jgi:hypothetical protein